MSHFSRPDSSYYLFLEQCDKDSLVAMQLVGCIHCSGVLDLANYKRKARAFKNQQLEPMLRYSLCCRSEGCRKRHAPPSVRFMGRKVFLSFFILLASSLPAAKAEVSCERLARDLGVSRFTLKRWLLLWRERFFNSSFWRRSRGCFSPCFPKELIPESLLGAFKCGDDFNVENWVKLLLFIAPFAADCSQ